MMNSTVSHEMRNPLNAIVSHADEQARAIASLREIISEIDGQHK